MDLTGHLFGMYVDCGVLLIWVLFLAFVINLVVDLMRGKPLNPADSGTHSQSHPTLG